MDIQDLRKEIDGIDSQLVALFVKRMGISAQVAAYKRENGLPIHVPSREQEILETVAAEAGSELSEYAKTLYQTIFALSRSYQGEHSGDET